jgi:hypothetical protein
MPIKPDLELVELSPNQPSPHQEYLTRNQRFMVLTPYRHAEGNTVSTVIRELLADPARSKNLGMHGISMLENWEPPMIARPDGGDRPRGEGQGRNPSIHGHGKFDSPVVPVKPSNNTASAVAEMLEERGLARAQPTHLLSATVFARWSS